MHGNQSYCMQIPREKHVKHTKIDEKIHTNKENLCVKLYTQIVIICVYSVYWLSECSCTCAGGFNLIA